MQRATAQLQPRWNSLYSLGYRCRDNIARKVPAEMQIMRPYPQLLPPAPVTGVRVTGDFCCGNQSLHSLDLVH
jgi:hypothetical protein